MGTWVGIVLQGILAAVSIGAAVYTAKKYGDVAGAKTLIDWEKENARKARAIALRALLNEVSRVRASADHNLNLSTTKTHLQGLARIPTITFETAFVSARSSVLAEGDTEAASRLLRLVTDYLTEASAINTFIDLYLATGTGLGPAGGPAIIAAMNYAVSQVQKRCKKLLTTLNSLEEKLQSQPVVNAAETGKGAEPSAESAQRRG